MAFMGDSAGPFAEDRRPAGDLPATSTVESLRLWPKSPGRQKVFTKPLPVVRQDQNHIQIYFQAITIQIWTKFVIPIPIMCMKAHCSICSKLWRYRPRDWGVIDLKPDKITWWGCGNHIPSVMDSVPQTERCTCEPQVDKEGKKYPPKAAKADWLHGCVTF
jgi:hypothetical protein